jgi:hypothetical protein
MARKSCSIAVLTAYNDEQYICPVGRDAKWAAERIKDAFNLDGGVLYVNGKVMRGNKKIKEGRTYTYEGATHRREIPEHY